MKLLEIYFNRCAGCHGATRKEQLSPSLLPEGDGKFAATRDLGAPGLRVFYRKWNTERECRVEGIFE